MTTWWNRNVEKRIDEFKSWIGDFNQPSKTYCRKYIAKKKYKTVIDCGCGLATDYMGFKEDNYEVCYMGLDSCKYLVELNRKNGIPMIEAELEETLPIRENSYECVYCREVLEHLSYYEKTLNELIRIASKEVVVVFFIKPDDQDDEINYSKEEDLYHNKYNKEKLIKFIENNPKVRSVKFKNIVDIPYVVPEPTYDEDADPADIEVAKSNVVQPSGDKVVLHILVKSNL